VLRIYEGYGVYSIYTAQKLTDSQIEKLERGVTPKELRVVDVGERPK